MSSASRTTAILSKRLRTSSRRSLSTTTSINSNASTWTRPLPEGSNPAYDASLAFLAQHSSSLLSKAERLRTRLSTVEDGELKSEIEIALKKAELEARIARPETRWLHENGNDVSSEGVEAGDREALNVLAERRWRKLGKLDRLVSVDTRLHGSRRSACFQTDFLFPVRSYLDDSDGKSAIHERRPRPRRPPQPRDRPVRLLPFSIGSRPWRLPPSLPGELPTDRDSLFPRYVLVCSSMRTPRLCS